MPSLHGPYQGQWWSIFSTHLPHRTGGLMFLKRLLNLSVSKWNKCALHVAGRAVMTPVRLDHLTAVTVTYGCRDKSRLVLGNNLKSRNFGHRCDERYLLLLCGCREADCSQLSRGSLAGILASLPFHSVLFQPLAGKTGTGTMPFLNNRQFIPTEMYRQAVKMCIFIGSVPLWKGLKVW